MTESTRQPSKTISGLWPIWLAAGFFFVLGIAVWGTTFGATDDKELHRKLLSALGAAGLTLAFGGVAGGFLTQLFKVWDARRTSLAAEQAFYRAGQATQN